MEKKRCQCKKKDGTQCTLSSSQPGINPKTKNLYNTTYCRRFHQACKDEIEDPIMAISSKKNASPKSKSPLKRNNPEKENRPKIRNLLLDQHL